jgi:ATP-dependent Lon protease
MKNDRPRHALPLLPLRDIIVFPHMVSQLFVGREKSHRGARRGDERDKEIFLAAQKNARRPTSRPRGHLRGRHRRRDHAAAPPARRHGEGARRGQAPRAHQAVRPTRPTSSCEVRDRGDLPASVEVEALMRSVQRPSRLYVKLNKKIQPEVLMSVQAIDDPARLATRSSPPADGQAHRPQELLETEDAVARLERSSS